jgi:hypothetical protein
MKRCDSAIYRPIFVAFATHTKTKDAESKKAAIINLGENGKALQP